MGIRVIFDFFLIFMDMLESLFDTCSSWLYWGCAMMGTLSCYPKGVR